MIRYENEERGESREVSYFSLEIHDTVVRRNLNATDFPRVADGVKRI
jgi:hypothetical protein